MGFRIIVPSMMGYAGSDAPQDLNRYTYKSASDDIYHLSQHLGLTQIILGGHDWGGAIVWRVALYYPQLVSHIFSVCTPYLPPQKNYISLQDMVETKLPFFRYQIQLTGTELEAHVQDIEQMKQLLRGMYGARGPNGEVGFEPSKGVLIKHLSKLGPSPLMSSDILDYYAGRYMEHGIGPTCNWYRSYDLKARDDAALSEKKINVPSLFIAATRDTVLKPELGAAMPSLIPHLTLKEVAASHWALWEKPDEVNAIIREWFNDVVIPKVESRL